MNKSQILSVIVPVFNEESTIAQLLEHVRSIDIVLETIVVDDGSTDATSQILDDCFSEYPDVVIVHQEKNSGKGAAIRAALSHVKGELVIIQDADLEYDPDDYPDLVQPILDAKADVVFGSRRTEAPKISDVLNPFFHGVTVLNFLVRWIYGLQITDEATCYKLFKTATLREMNLQCERFEFCPEVTAKVARMNLRLVEVPIRYSPRSLANGKKIGLKDAFEAALTLWRYRRWQPVSVAKEVVCRDAA